MRTIQVSPDVFAAIWSARKLGQDTEDAILRGVFQLSKASGQPEHDIITTVGFHDPRYGVKLPVDFQIFRTYKGKEYRARAIQGFWHWNGTGYPTLNELNKAIGIVGPENAWKAWYYVDGTRRRPLSDLRDQSTIVRRSAQSGIG
jgi:hypothetical protein